MTRGYGVRFADVKQFINYCGDLNVRTDEDELEHYEKTGVLLPVARVSYPHAYIIHNAQQSWGPSDNQRTLEQWPDVEQLKEKLRILPEDYSNLIDDELLHCFDREMGRNQYLSSPIATDYKPWSSYKVSVPCGDGLHLGRSTADHFYSYWQVHQLHFIQKYPDLYKNRILLDRIPDDEKRGMFRPRQPTEQSLREFNGLARGFDALSFWCTVYFREQNRTFALVPEHHGAKQLDDRQVQIYREKI